MIIYHITSAEEWKTALFEGMYEAASLKTEGFIHCSTDKQVQGVLDRYFQGKTNLLKLVIDTDKLENELKFELAPSVNQEFPHVYGAINLDAVIGVLSANDSTENTSESHNELS
jgi:uncharacterized protein (DUF952 family)